MTLERDVSETALAQLKPLPGILTEIIKVLRDERSSARDVERAMSYDQAITAKVLRIANSAFYGHRGEVKTVKQAIALIGYSASLQIAIGVGLKKALESSDQTQGAYSPEYWVHSLVTAVFARSIGRHFKSSGHDDLFLAGLMHDVGWGALANLPPKATVVGTVLEEGDPVTSRERSVFGVDHQALGSELLRTWGFPDAVAALIGHHHTPARSPERMEKDTSLLHLADYLANLNGFGFPGDREFEHLSENVKERFVPTQEAVDSVLGSLAEEFELVDDLMEAFMT